MRADANSKGFGAMESLHKFGCLGTGYKKDGYFAANGMYLMGWMRQLRAF